MATTLFTDVDDSVPKIWSSFLRAEAQNLTFWNRFEGPEGSSMPVIRKDELTSKAGDTIYTDLVLALTGAGVSGDTNLLVGNEEKLKFRQNSFTVSEVANAAEWSEYAQKHNIHDLRNTSLRQLAKWLADRLDDDLFAEFTGDGNVALPTANVYLAGANATIAGVDTADIPTLDEISEVKSYAQTDLRIEPMRLDNGDEFFGMVLHPKAALALRQATDFKQANREAFNGTGYGTNPLFRGSIGQWDGVIFYVNNNVPIASDGTGNIPVARNIFFGAQAVSRGFSMYPNWREGEKDYGRFGAVATVCYKGEALNVFDFSAAGDNSAKRAIGSLVYYSAVKTPTPIT